MKKLTVIFSLLTLITGLAIGPVTVMSANTRPARDITLDDPSIVNEISFATHSISQGEISSFMVKFSEKKKDQIQNGDTLKLKLPKGIAGLQTSGAPTKLELKNADGVLFANAIIYNDEVIVTFTEAVNNLDNINGYFNVAIVGSNANDDANRDKDYEVTDLNMGLPPVNSKNEPMNKNGLTIRGVPQYVPERPSGDFGHYKSGDMLNGFDEVRWFINVNSNQAKVKTFDKNIIIKDTLGPGQELQPNTFMVSSTTWVNDKPVTSWEPLAKILKTQDNPDGWATATLDKANNSFTVELDVTHAPGNTKLDGTSFALSYTTKVTDGSLDNFTNSYDIDYQIDGKDPVHDTKTIPVKNIRAGGGADGDGRPKPPSTLKEFEANVLNGDPDEPEEETVDPLPNETPEEEHATESTEPDESGKVTEEKPPVILNDSQLIEEILTEEQLEILEDVIKEHAEGHLEDDHTHVVEVDGKPLVLNDSQIIEEILTEDQAEKLKDIIEEHADMTDVPDDKGNATENKPEIIEPKPEKKPKSDVDPVPTPKPNPDVKPVPKPDIKPTPNVKPAPNPEFKDTVKPTGKQVVEQKTTNSAKKSAELPATGYNNGFLLSVVGFLIAVFGLFFFKKSRNN